MGTIELATLVLLDSGRLQEEFSKREARWEKRHPDKVPADDAEQEHAYAAAIELAHAGDLMGMPAVAGMPSGSTVTMAAPPTGTAATGEHVATALEPNDGRMHDPEAG